MSKVMLSVRVEALLKDALYEEARLENRSAANMLEVLLDERYGRAARNAPDSVVLTTGAGEFVASVPARVQDVPVEKNPAPRSFNLPSDAAVGARDLASRGGRCGADVARGTKCKLCGKVH